MSEYVEKCPYCNNHSLEVTQHDPRGQSPCAASRWGEERRSSFAPSLLRSYGGP